jgi:hypothetical protein
MSPPRLEWTPEMIAALKALRAEGLSLYRCAERIGVAYPTCVFKARELGIAKRIDRKKGSA